MIKVSTFVMDINGEERTFKVGKKGVEKITIDEDKEFVDVICEKNSKYNIKFLKIPINDLDFYNYKEAYFIK